MREIKFRAWHRGIPKRVRYSGTPAQMLYDEKPGECLIFLNQGQDIEEVMQFTGIHDTQGKEIYEGDIVKSGNLLQKVYYDEEGAAFKVKCINCHDETGSFLRYWKGEVIGNIYENELLKDGKNE